jgi:hypothetical protein
METSSLVTVENVHVNVDEFTHVTSVSTIHMLVTQYAGLNVTLRPRTLGKYRGCMGIC